VTARPGIATLAAATITAVIAAVAWCYCPREFLADDLTLVHAGRAMMTENFLRPFHDAWIWRDIAPSWAFLEYYRPLTVLSFGIDWLLWGFQPAGYYATNLLLHLLGAALVWRLAVLVFPGAPAWKPGLAAALFALHPGHEYNLLWLSGRGDVLCAVFVLLSLICLTAWLRGGRASAAAGHLIFTLAAFATKENAFALPLLAACLIAYEYRDLDRHAMLLPLLPTVACAGAFLLLRLALFGMENALPGSGAGGAPAALYQFARQLALPYHLHLRRLLSDPFTLFFLALTLWEIVARTVRRANPGRVLLFIALTAAAIAPTASGFMPWYLYLPSVGFCLLLAEILASDRRLRPIAAALAALLLASYAAAWLHRAPAWREAGQVAREFATDYAALAREHPDRQVVLLSVPGALNAVPMFFHNLAARLALEPGTFDDDPEIALFIDGTGTTPEAFTMSTEPTGPSSFRLTLDNNGSYFSPHARYRTDAASDPANVAFLATDARGFPTSAQVTLDDDTRLILQFDHTGIHPLEP
jgi:hypothetical protein